MKTLCFDIGGTYVKYGVLDEKGDFLLKDQMPTYASEGGERLMQRLLEVIEQMGDIGRVGISTAGQIDSKEGSVIFGSENIPGWTGMPIRKRVEQAFGIPCKVENDVNAAALGEAYFGAGKGIDDFLCLAYGTGVGGAIVQNRKVYTGATGSAGEFGHMVTHADGIACGCGMSGCYEQYASTRALARQVKSKLGIEGEVDGRMIFSKIEKDTNYKACVDEWIGEIGLGLRSLIHIFNPSHIIMGGGIMEQPYVVEGVRKYISKNVMPSYAKVVIKAAEQGNDAGMLGAYALFL